DEMLARAYGYRQEKHMRAAMERIVDTCRGTKDRHFAWVACLVEGHMEGIAAHACHHISSGRVEGTNQMIKTLRRAG
ncbi:MAG: ISL3 family transposase, partial [Coriobacteriaceae bacterium]